jgi:flagellar biosynthesis/type III secretory pathway protein FliH
MTLPKELQTGLVRKIRSFEEEKKMPLISPTEQLAMERGEQRGLEQGLEQGLEREQQLIIKLLNRRLGQVEPSQLQAIYTLNFDQLDLLGEALLDFSSVADLQQWLESQ